MNKKRLIISASVLTTAIIALSVSLTLAWFGASDRLNVENMELTIYTQGNLKISTTPDDPTSFVEDLPESALKAGDDFLFAPVSSMYKNKWMDTKEDKPVFYDGSLKQVMSSGEPYADVAQFGYFQKEVYLLTTMHNHYAVLDFTSVDKDGNYLGCTFGSGDNSARAKEVYNQHPLGGLSEKQIEEKLDKLVNCLRMSILVKQENFYKYYIVDPMKKDGEVTYLGGRLDNNGNGYYDVYKDNATGENKEIVYGEVTDRSLLVYDEPSGVDVEPELPGDSFFVNSFEGVSRASAYRYNEEKSKENGAIAIEESYSPEDLKKEDTSLLIPLESNVPTKIILSYYLEGWDLDCINATMGASFTSKLSFKLKGGNI